MKKNAFFILAACLFSLSAKSQNNDKIINSWGFAAYTDLNTTPISKKTAIEPYSGLSETHYTQGFSPYSVSFMYRFRYNLSEMSDNAAISLDIMPAVGLATFRAVENTGLGYINIPVMVSYNFGVGSTYNSSAEKGGFIAAGIEYMKAPVVEATVDPNSRYAPITSSWMQPASFDGVQALEQKK